MKFQLICTLRWHNVSSVFQQTLGLFPLINPFTRMVLHKQFRKRKKMGLRLLPILFMGCRFSFIRAFVRPLGQAETVWSRESSMWMILLVLCETGHHFNLIMKGIIIRSRVYKDDTACPCIGLLDSSLSYGFIFNCTLKHLIKYHMIYILYEEGMMMTIF